MTSYRPTDKTANIIISMLINNIWAVLYITLVLMISHTCTYGHCCMLVKPVFYFHTVLAMKWHLIQLRHALPWVSLSVLFRIIKRSKIPSLPYIASAKVQLCLLLCQLGRRPIVRDRACSYSTALISRKIVVRVQKEHGNEPAWQTGTYNPRAQTNQNNRTNIWSAIFVWATGQLNSNRQWQY